MWMSALKAALSAIVSSIISGLRLRRQQREREEALVSAAVLAEKIRQAKKHRHAEEALNEIAIDPATRDDLVERLRKNEF